MYTGSKSSNRNLWGAEYVRFIVLTGAFAGTPAKVPSSENALRSVPLEKTFNRYANRSRGASSGVSRISHLKPLIVSDANRLQTASYSV